MSVACVIFDMDGTLVDSETLCNRALLDMIPQWDETPASVLARYRGEKFARIRADIEARLGITLDEDFEPRYRAHMLAMFDKELTAMPGVPEMLQALTLPRCIASSGPLAKIKHALAITGLGKHFNEKLFSAYEVGSWKPEPGLFLHTAAAMGFAPADCIVIEDSSIGVAAAEAAGMRALHYLPYGGEAHPHAQAFADMRALPGLLDQLRTADGTQ